MFPLKPASGSVLFGGYSSVTITDIVHLNVQIGTHRETLPVLFMPLGTTGASHLVLAQSWFKCGLHLIDYAPCSVSIF